MNAPSCPTPVLDPLQTKKNRARKLLTFLETSAIQTPHPLKPTYAQPRTLRTPNPDFCGKHTTPARTARTLAPDYQPRLPSDNMKAPYILSCINHLHPPSRYKPKNQSQKAVNNLELEGGGRRKEGKKGGREEGKKGRREPCTRTGCIILTVVSFKSPYTATGTSPVAGCR